jgi:hypothetical protein
MDYKKELIKYIEKENKLIPKFTINKKSVEEAIIETVGGKILAKKPSTFAKLFDIFTEYMETEVKWHWNGSLSYSSTKVLEVLDGTCKEGECKIFAAALLALWNFPSPFGLAMPGGSIVEYKPKDDKEFFAYHPVEGIYGARPNVLKLSTTKENFLLIPSKLNSSGWSTVKDYFQPLRMWSDHKVIEYKNIFYDPSYKKKYNSIKSMVAFSILSVSLKTKVMTVKVQNANVEKKWGSGNTLFLKFFMDFGGYKGPVSKVDDFK